MPRGRVGVFKPIKSTHLVGRIRGGTRVVQVLSCGHAVVLPGSMATKLHPETGKVAKERQCLACSQDIKKQQAKAARVVRVLKRDDLTPDEVLAKAVEAMGGTDNLLEALAKIELAALKQ